tara:strand:+ start:23116 stop:24186 length:1071 start_codon:yes stop_codon:yes gene_type:complete
MNSFNHKANEIGIEGINDEYEELDLSSTDGLNAFVQASEDVFIEATKQYRAAGLTDQSLLRDLEKNYAEIQDAVINCHDNLCTPGKDISDEVIDQLQADYNALVLLRDNIFASAEQVADEEGESLEEEKQSVDRVFVPEDKKRKTMILESSADEVSLEIKVANEAEEQIKETVLPSTPVAPKPVSSHDEVQAVGTLEHGDPINEVIVAGGERIPLAKRELPADSLTNRYLQDKHYNSFLRSVGMAPVEFEKKLRAEIALIESPGKDTFEKWLGVTSKSPFDYLQDMTVGEVKEFVDRPDTIKIVRSKGVKYETFLIWIDLMPDMLSVVGDNPDMAFGELFARYVIESAMQYQDSAI